MTGRLAGKVAIITGGGRGIGAGITRRFVEEGAKVAVVQRNPPPDDMTGDGVLFVPADLSRSEDIRKAVAATVERFGGLDILVNNAGIMFEKTVEEMTEQDWDRMMAVNLKAPFLLTKAAMPYLRRRGGGAIVTSARSRAWAPTPAILPIPPPRRAFTALPPPSPSITDMRPSAATRSRPDGSIRTSAKPISRAWPTARVSAANCSSCIRSGASASRATSATLPYGSLRMRAAS